MAELSYIEKDTIDRMFNNGGYVLGFSTAEFDRFTIDSVGIPLCEEYRLSKGKSLREFIDVGEDFLVGKLLTDLLEYYRERYTEKLQVSETKITFEKCCLIANKLCTNDSNSIINERTSTLIDVFDSQYITAQIMQMNNSIDSNPTDAIGKAKDLLESCCKTILIAKGIEVDKNWDIPRLTKETLNELKLTPSQIPDSAKGSEIIKKILGNLSSVSHNMAELRNYYGTGHGKDSKYVGLTPRHARLAVGSVTTLVYFLWETFKEKDFKE